MSHSHDKTLLASLAFADPDKKDQMHDLACEYLSQPAQAKRIVELAEASVEKVEATMESPISKGEGQYKTTIGFVDVLLEWAASQRKGKVIVEVKISPVGVGDIVRQLNLYSEYLEMQGQSFGRGLDSETFTARLHAINGTVRPPAIASVPAYRVLATAFDLDAGQVDVLKREGIHVIRLGESFNKWFEERSKQPKPQVPQF